MYHINHIKALFVDNERQIVKNKMTVEEYFKEWGSICRVYQNEDLIHPHSTLLQFAEAYHQEKMKEHDALVKMMAQDEKEGNYEEKCCDRPTTFFNIGLDDICVNCGKNITPSPPSNL